MKKPVFLRLTSLFLCLAILTSLIGISNVSGASVSTSPRNIIFMIGDGMGPNQVQMAADHQGSPLYMQGMPYQGTSSTANVEGGVTDSAAGGTALACGVKTKNRYIGKNSAGQDVQNLREYFAEMGKKTGIISTVSITDATPASFGAHNIDRGNQTQIANDYINKHEIDIIMGGGANNFSAALINTAKQKGYTHITNRTQLLETDATKLLALFTPGDFPYYADANGYPSNIPTLEEMTLKCISILNQNPNGFFLMVEGGAIDHAGHDNNIARNIGETLQFDKAVKAALDFAEQDGNTLVIVTADHETGGLKKEGSTYRFTSSGHTGADVPVFAYGVGAENFTGAMVNTDISKKIKELLKITSADKSELEVAIAKANALKEDNYTSDSWEALQDAFDEAIAVYGNADATQEEVEEAVFNLNKAMDELIPFLGDVNLDAEVSTLDALMVLQHVSDRIELTQEQAQRADVNRDENVTSQDALIILQFVSERRPDF